ncbi:MAG: hypothetical protein WAL63_18970 [Solirubrobacteraceae bacterium]
MTNPIPPSLERFGDDLNRAACRELPIDSGPVRARVRLPRPRFLARGSLALVGVAAAVLFAFSGTAATPPAYAITKKSDGTVLVKINYGGRRTLLAADGELVARFHETALVNPVPGPATVNGPVSCRPTPDTAAPGDPLPPGPRVKVLLGKDGTGVIPSGDTGAGTVHLSSCQTYVSYPDSNTGSGSTGNG